MVCSSRTSAMSVLACGLNTSGQVVGGGPGVLCCPAPVCVPPGVTAARVAFSHILWSTDSGSRWTGHDIEGFEAEVHLEAGWKVFVCENRIAAINDDGSVLVWEKEKQWKTLHFQKKHADDETLDEHLSKDDHSTNDEREERANVDVSIRHESEQTEHEGTKRKNVENSLHDELPPKVNENQEIVNKRLKLETVAKTEDKWPISDDSCPEKTRIIFTKVAVEDNSLLALDADGVMYCGSVPVALQVKVRDVAVGKEHSMALTVAGDVLTWGSGMRGQLGIGELCQSEKPVPVESLQGVPVTAIACGAWHCVALSGSGDLYVWGWNESGQLGFPYKCEGSQSLFSFFEHSCRCPKSDVVKQGTDDHSTREPMQSDQLHVQEKKDVEETQGKQKEGKNNGIEDKRINPERNQEVINVQASPLLFDFWTEDVNITDVQCGDRHTLYMLDDGSVWSAGMNRYGQLGLGHVRAVQEPCRVFRGGVRGMCAGGWNSVFLTAEGHPTP